MCKFTITCGGKNITKLSLGVSPGTQGHWPLERMSSAHVVIPGSLSSLLARRLPCHEPPGGAGVGLSAPAACQSWGQPFIRWRARGLGAPGSLVNMRQNSQIPTNLGRYLDGCPDPGNRGQGLSTRDLPNALAPCGECQKPPTLPAGTETPAPF